MVTKISMALIPKQYTTMSIHIYIRILCQTRNRMLWNFWYKRILESMQLFRYIWLIKQIRKQTGIPEQHIRKHQFEHACFSECQHNTYGAGCSERCGHCLNGKGCDHVNGTCPSGCDAGYYGSGCKRGRLNNTIRTVVS